MAVDLKNIPDTCIRPTPPRLSRWIVFLIFLIGLSIVYSRLVTGENNVLVSVGIPGIITGCLYFSSYLIYLLKQIFASAYDKERENTIIQEVRRGRRALQILAAECCTAHSEPETPLASVSANLLRNDNVLFTQRSWRDEENIRLSQLARIAGLSDEKHLEMLFISLAKQLAQTLALLPADKPLLLLFESSSSIPEEKAEALWWQAWKTSGIQQSCSRISGSGMQVVDEWLDHRIHSDALLLVVSWQYSPVNTPMSAEAITGILLGNRLTQHAISPLAFLHRPEAVGTSPDAFEYALGQALDWVPLAPAIPGHIWLAGVTTDDSEHIPLMKAISSASLSGVDQQTGVHDFTDYLGLPDKAASWLAVAAAAQAIQQHPAYHLLICREQQNGKVWNMIVSPAISGQEGER